MEEPPRKAGELSGGPVLVKEVKRIRFRHIYEGEKRVASFTKQNSAAPRRSQKAAACNKTTGRGMKAILLSIMNTFDFPRM